VLLAPADAVAEMRKESADWSGIEPRVISLDVKVGKKGKRSPKRIALTPRFAPAQRRPGIPDELDVRGRGQRLARVHEGDSTGNIEEYRRFGWASPPWTWPWSTSGFPRADPARFFRKT